MKKLYKIANYIRRKLGSDEDPPELLGHQYTPREWALHTGNWSSEHLSLEDLEEYRQRLNKRLREYISNISWSGWGFPADKIPQLENSIKNIDAEIESRKSYKQAALSKKAKTIDQYVKDKLIEIYKEVGEYPPDDVRVRTTGQAPINVTVWSDSYAPEMRVTFENRLTQHFDPNNEGTYRFEVIFFDPETGAES